MKFSHAVLILSLFGAFTAHADQPGGKVECKMDKTVSLTDMSQLDAKTTVSNCLNTNDAPSTPTPAVPAEKSQTGV